MKKLITLTFLAMIVSFASFAIYPIYGTPGTCVGANQYLFDSSFGGLWSSSNTAVAVVGSTDGIAYGVSAGVATITYAVGSGFVTMAFTVTATPPAPITGTTTLCVGATTTLSDADPGGYWYTGNPGAAVVGTGTGIVTGVSADTASIFYEIGAGCYRFTVVTVLATTPPAPITGDSVICVGSSSLYTDATSGGTWSSSNTAIATVGASTGIVSGVSAGPVAISYTMSGSCASASMVRYALVSSTTVTGDIDPFSVASAAALCPGNLWYFNATIPGGTWSSSNTAIATIGSVTGLETAVSAGTATITYTVSGCSGVAYTTCTVGVVSTISGQVVFSGSGYTGSVMVWLITYNPSSHDLEAVDSQVVMAGGWGGSNYYYFNAPADSFRLKAAIDTLVPTGFIPTYHDSSVYWHDAAVIYHTPSACQSGQDIYMITGAPTAGPGFISGDVTTGANKGTAGVIPSIGMHICVVNSATGQPVQQTRTDASGHYSFSNLPVGVTYHVFPDSLNYLTTPYTSVTLTAASPSMTAASFIQHTLSKTITPVLEKVHNVPSSPATIVSFPNPTNGLLNIQWDNLAQGNASVVVTDPVGREVHNSQIVLSKSSGKSQINLTNLDNGIYFINLTTDNYKYTGKLTIQK